MKKAILAMSLAVLVSNATANQEIIVKGDNITVKKTEEHHKESGEVLHNCLTELSTNISEIDSALNEDISNYPQYEYNLATNSLMHLNDVGTRLCRFFVQETRNTKEDVETMDSLEKELLDTWNKLRTPEPTPNTERSMEFMLAKVSLLTDYFTSVNDIQNSINNAKKKTHKQLVAELFTDVQPMQVDPAMLKMFERTKYLAKLLDVQVKFAKDLYINYIKLKKEGACVDKEECNYSEYPNEYENVNENEPTETP